MFTENNIAGKQTYLYYIVLYYIPKLRNKEKRFVISLCEETIRVEVWRLANDAMTTFNIMLFIESIVSTQKLRGELKFENIE